MASLITISTNLGKVFKETLSKFDLLKDKEYLLRPLAIETIPNMKERIHKEGQASDASQIGTYSSEYMKLRTGNYGNSEKFSKGKNIGKLKNAGFFTKGQNATQNIKTKKLDSKRPSYNRSNDTKIIVSLTRQLENDYAVLPTTNGYGIGFNNSLNTKKAGWVEGTKKKIIFNLSQKEKEYIEIRVNELVNAIINP